MYQILSTIAYQALYGARSLQLISRVAQQVTGLLVSEWLLFDANSVIFQLYQGEKLR
jgi:hypothetical protein